MTKTIRIEVRKNPNETATSLIRRFSKRVQTAGVLRAARARRYQERTKSEYVKKKFALARLDRMHQYELQKKLGLIRETPRPTGRPR